jgi:hypothetical protein
LLSSALLAATSAGFDLSGVAMQTEHEQVQIHWMRSTSKKTEGLDPQKSNEVEIARKAAQGYLRECGQPSNYLTVHTAALTALAQNNILGQKPGLEANNAEEPKPAIQFNHLQTILKETFTGGAASFATQGSEQSLEVGQWWLRDDTSVQSPLADRIEAEVVRLLNKNPGRTFRELEHSLFKTFPGLFTPEEVFVLACLESYAQQDPPESGLWRLADQDQPSQRRSDLQKAREMVERLGEKLGYQLSSKKIFEKRSWSNQHCHTLHLVRQRGKARVCLLCNRVSRFWADCL